MYAQSYKAVNVVTPAAITTTTTGAAIDLGAYASGANRTEKYVFQLGGVAGTTPSIIVSITECATSGGTYTAPVGGTTTSSAQTTNGLVELNVFRSFQFVKSVVTFTANTTSAIVGVVAYVTKRDDPLQA